MKKVITYGTFDLLHHGHVNLLRRAKMLGDYLIVGVTSDSFDRERGKLNVRKNVLERIEAVKATGYADEVIIEDYIGQKIDDIQKYDIDIFAIGSDWKGKFDYLNEYCEVVYLPRTEGVSSTMLRAENQQTVRLGVVGTGRIAKRFIPEAHFVEGIDICSVFNIQKIEAVAFAKANDICAAFDDYEHFLKSIDAVYIASPHLSHYHYAKQALLAGKHVLCEIPFVLKESEAVELYELATERGLVLLEANKTAHCPAWNHLLVLVKSGLIGEVIEVKASASKLVHEGGRELDPEQMGGSMTEHSSIPLMAIIKLLGLNISDIHFYSKIGYGVDIFTKGIINYDQAVASITLGLGVKTEGNLVVSGTKGYALVPSPWWLTNYFELCYENKNLNKKDFYPYEGDGLRYEIQEFISMIVNHRLSSYRLQQKESVCIAKIIETYISKENITFLK